MSTYYVDSVSGNDSTGTGTKLNPWKTLSHAEANPVAAADLVVARGGSTFRETLTCGVSGSVGNPIQYLGDYNGAIWGDAGGLVRITGSDNDQAATRANCIVATTKTYRTFSGFMIDSPTGAAIFPQTGCTNWILDKLILTCFGVSSNYGIMFQGTPSANTIQNCAVLGGKNRGISFFSAATTTGSGNLVDNCLVGFIAGNTGIGVDRVGGVTVKNTTVMGCSSGIRVQTALAAGQVLTANNNIVAFNNFGFNATATTDISEDYNVVWNNTDYTNTTAGAHDLTYLPLLDPRWFFQLVFAGAGPNSPLQLASLFDLASFNQIINVAGTSPTSTDLRGTGTIGTNREWGALEYDSSLKIFGGIKKSRIWKGE